jgi:hypothetical protein
VTPSRPTASPDRIVDIAIGFMGAKQLITASRIGLFDALHDGPATAAELAQRTGVAERQARILADSMNAQGLLTRVDGRYGLEPDAAAYLTGAHADVDLAPFLAFLGATSYPQWLGYDHTVDTDEAGTLDLDEVGWDAFLEGVMTYNELHGAMFADAFDFTPFRDALDLGGLSPAFALGGLRSNPELNVRFVYAPDFADSVRETVQAAGFGARTEVEGADTAAVEPEGSHDLVMVNHVIHRFDEQQNLEILRHARAAAADGATLTLLDFYLDDEPRQRAIDALHAGEYYNIDGTVVWPLGTVRSWLRETGWEPRELLALPGSPRILVATAV